MKLPDDPAILMSFLNTKLRDEYPSLDALCDGLEIDGETLARLLEEHGLCYDAGRNRVENR